MGPGPRLPRPLGERSRPPRQEWIAKHVAQMLPQATAGDSDAARRKRVMILSVIVYMVTPVCPPGLSGVAGSRVCFVKGGLGPHPSTGREDNPSTSARGVSNAYVVWGSRRQSSVTRRGCETRARAWSDRELASHLTLHQLLGPTPSP